MKIDPSKLKNYGLWVAVASLVYLIATNLGVDIDQTKFDHFVELVLGILVLLGIISNPKEGKWFSDDPPKE